MSENYQRGSIRKVSRAKGKQVWEWRFRVRGVMKQETFPVERFPTKTLLWKHLESRINHLNDDEVQTDVITQEAVVAVVPTMGDLIQKYIVKQLPELAKSTRDTDGSMLRVHLLPRWSDTAIADVHAEDVEDWIKTLPLSAASRGRARRLMKQLIDRAMFWRFIPVAQNPMKLIRVKGVTKRQKPIITLSVQQVNEVIAELASPYSLMLLLCAAVGLRIEETIALHWDDFDFFTRKVTIKRAYTHGELKEAKTLASHRTLPVPEVVITALADYRTRCDSDLVFPSPYTGRYMSTDSARADHLQPAAQRCGLPKIGWHCIRHSYKAWQGSSDAKPAELKDLMGHADISTTMDIYGGTPVEVMRPYVDAIGRQLRIN